jgi:predicted permease
VRRISNVPNLAKEANIGCRLARWDELVTEKITLFTSHNVDLVPCLVFNLVKTNGQDQGQDMLQEDCTFPG